MREPLLIRRELFAQAEITDVAFETKLSEWEFRGRPHTAVSSWINGRTASTAQADGEPSHVFTTVAAIDVVDLPRTGGAMRSLWTARLVAAGSGNCCPFDARSLRAFARQMTSVPICAYFLPDGTVDHPPDAVREPDPTAIVGAVLEAHLIGDAVLGLVEIVDSPLAALLYRRERKGDLPAFLGLSWRGLNCQSRDAAKGGDQFPHCRLSIRPRVIVRAFDRRTTPCAGHRRRRLDAAGQRRSTAQAFTSSPKAVTTDAALSPFGYRLRRSRRR